MQVNLQSFFSVALFALASGFTFAQETDPQPKQESIEVKRETVVYDVVDEVAAFPGGVSALRKYLLDNIVYPEHAVKNKIQGKCYIQFVVMDTGKIQSVVVKKGVTDCPECDAEALRVVKSMPNWTPGKINGKAVNSIFLLPVSFKL